MAGAAAERASSASLSIGQVLAKLTPEFPALTSSKLRYLEDQGIVAPKRTDGGYRKFSSADVDRLRLGLTLQRDQYLPLSVIRDHLDADGDTTPPPSIHPARRTYTRAELLTAAGAVPQVLNDAVSLGFLAASERYGEEALTLLRALVALDRHGIEPRHLRALQQSAKRDADLVATALRPLLRRTDARSKGRAEELSGQLAGRMSEVRELFLADALRDAID